MACDISSVEVAAMMSSTIDLYFVAVCKRGDVLFAEHGPFIVIDKALELADEPLNDFCYRKVVKVTLPCEVL